MADSLRLQTLALMGQQFLAQALAGGGSLDAAMRESLVPASAASGREKSALALTGRIRADAAGLRQRAQNASEGAVMASLISETSLALGETLSSMQTIVQSYKAGQTGEEEAQTAFASLAQTLSSVLSGARYNGISLVDSAGWAGDERLEVSGGTASLSLNMGGGMTAFSLRDLSFLQNFESADLAAENTADGLAGLMEELSAGIGVVNSMASGYKAIAGAYESQAKALESQAATMAKAAKRAITEAGKHPADVASPGTEKSLDAILFDVLLRDSGKMVNTSS